MTVPASVPTQPRHRAPPDDGSTQPLAPHLASRQDDADARSRATRLAEILLRADRRDHAAEKRDRRAEARWEPRLDPHAWLDREWAGRDRDAAAIDRADLIDLLNPRG